MFSSGTRVHSCGEQRMRNYRKVLAVSRDGDLFPTLAADTVFTTLI